MNFKRRKTKFLLYLKKKKSENIHYRKEIDLIKLIILPFLVRKLKVPPFKKKIIMKMFHFLLKSLKIVYAIPFSVLKKLDFFFFDFLKRSLHTGYFHYSSVIHFFISLR